MPNTRYKLAKSKYFLLSLLLFFISVLALTFLTQSMLTTARSSRADDVSNKSQNKNKHKNSEEVIMLSDSPAPSVPNATTTMLTPLLNPLPSPTPAVNQTWQIQSVSSMKETKDRICSPRSKEYIDAWVGRAKELGVNYVAVETSYDNPACASAVAYTEQWVSSIRAHGLKVWHRHMPLAFEGIYDVAKSTQPDFLLQISQYIKENAHLFAEGDIFTPTPEPQNGGIAGITHCAQEVCQFRDAAHFNQWLRDSMSVSRTAFAEVGLGEQVKIGFFGFDGFVAWGHNNPDWEGILEDQTVTEMGNITIDHYPEIVGDTMENSLNELEARYPGVPIIIGEWGTINNAIDYVQQVETTLHAANRPSVIGVNYWHMGVGGNEALVLADMTVTPHFFTVQKFFKSGI